MGGYHDEYEALDRNLMIDLTSLLDDAEPEGGRVIAVEMARLDQQRGDVHASVGIGPNGGQFAYVAGGFHHTNDWCAPLSSVEMYDFDEDAWSDASDLGEGRGDKALVFSGNRLYAVGGETRPKDQCLVEPEDVPLIQDQSLVLDDVEVYDPANADGGWEELDALPEARFRFSAAAWEGDDEDENDDGTVFVFGGQTEYDLSCECFRTSNTIFSYGKSSNTLSSGHSILTGGGW